MSERILQHCAAKICTITLNQPERLNPVDFTVLVDLAAMLRVAAADPDVRVVVLTGAGKAFSAGGDMKVMRDLKDGVKPSREESVRAAREAAGACELLHGMRKPTIAMIRGAAAGGGLGLAAACDIRIASETAKLTFAYPKIGLAGDIGTSFFVRRLLGPGQAASFCMLSPVVDAARALDLGLVNQVVPDADLETVTHEIAAALAASPPLALAGIKANLSAAETMALAAALDVEAANFVEALGTADHKEAARAFLEKRKPVFSGR
jgi:2-(1,2-epoxy-1,2-dihydrophenyl)acetyl-CoA isomerase